VPTTTTVKGGAGIPLTGVPTIETPGVFNPNDPVSMIQQQQIAGAPTAVSTTHTNTVPTAPMTGVVATGAVGTNPILTTTPQPEQTALNNPNAPPVQQPTGNLTLPEAAPLTNLNNPNALPPEPAGGRVAPSTETVATQPLPTTVKTGATGTGTGTVATPVAQPTAQPAAQAPAVPTVQPTVTTQSQLLQGATSTTDKSAAMLNDLMASQKDQQNQYMDKLNTMQFEYNAATDPDYILASKNMEQQVTDMMVGRGMLYSSVAQSALQSGLTALMAQYRQQAYDMFVQDRDFTLKMAQQLYDRQDTEFNKALSLYSAQTDRENTAWNQNMQMSEFEFNKQKEAYNQAMDIAKFEFTQKQSEFEQQLATAKFQADRQDTANQLALQKQQLAISQANAAYNRQLSEAKQKQAAAQTELSMMEADYVAANREWEYMQNKWREDGAADYEVANYFNVPIGADVSSQYGNRIYQSLYNLESQAQTVAAYAKQIGDAESYLDIISGFKDSTASAPTAADYDTAYSTAYSNIVASVNSGTKASALLADLAADRTEYVKAMGSTNYNKLVAYLDKRISDEG